MEVPGRLPKSSCKAWTSHKSVSNMAVMKGSYREPERAYSNISLQPCLRRQNHSLTDKQIHSKGTNAEGGVEWTPLVVQLALAPFQMSISPPLPKTHSHCLCGPLWKPEAALPCCLSGCFGRRGGRSMETWLNGSLKLGTKQSFLDLHTCTLFLSCKEFAQPYAKAQPVVLYTPTFISVLPSNIVYAPASPSKPHSGPPPAPGLPVPWSNFCLCVPDPQQAE